MRPAPLVDEVAREIARDLGLRPGWLNASGVGFLPDLPADRTERAVSLGGLQVAYADAKVLVAMKLYAARSRDVDDLVTLFPAAGISTPEEAVQVFRDVFPHGPAGRDLTDAELLIDAAEILELIRRVES